mgnify:CR=1 FL=1|jgi:uncharacterized protein
MTNTPRRGAPGVIFGLVSRENLQFDHRSPALLIHSLPMKLHADKLDTQSITAYGEGWIAVNGQRHVGSLVLASGGQLTPWACQRFEDLTAEHFEQLASTMPEAPELVVFGSGARLRFVRPALLQGLMERRIGVETMDTAAACRTYNILAGEGRRVVAALLIES